MKKIITPIAWEDREISIGEGDPCRMIEEGVHYIGKVKDILFYPDEHIILECEWTGAKLLDLSTPWHRAIAPTSELLQTAMSFIVIGPLDAMHIASSGRLLYSRRPNAEA